ncbi:MAG: hypothetical protein ACRDNS_13070 [Trebonia sp.]
MTGRRRRGRRAELDLLAELGAALALRVLALEARVAELESDRRRPPIVRVGGGVTVSCER